MKIEVEVISTEIIKPSSQTPDHLRHYTLSYIDQTSPKTYNPLVLFYDLNNDRDDQFEAAEISSRIKKSLSEALALYHPLAGRVSDDDRSVNCNDEGVPYSVARVASPNDLSDVVRNPNPSELAKLLPFQLHKTTEFAIGVRLNVFSSGGAAVGLCISHQLADALSCIAFVKSWAALACGGSGAAEKPQFGSAEIFPPRDDIEFDANSGITTEVVSKRFSFSAPEIEAVRAKYGRVSRVEALSAFIMSRLALASVLGDRGPGHETVIWVAHPVNVRPRLDPPLPENFFGNLYRCAFTVLRGSDVHVSDGGESLVKRIREEIKKVDSDFLKKVRESGEDESLKSFIEEAKRIAMEGGEFFTFAFTSLCRFPLYDADFGWGEPLWVSSAAMCFNNVVGFMDSKDGHGIEAYIGLKEEVMAKLEADQEFLKYVNVSLTTSHKIA